MRKITSLIAALAIIVSATSCSEENNTSVSSVSETTTASTSETAEETTAETETATKTEIKFDGEKYKTYASMTPEEIVGTLTLEQKAAQMVQPAIYNITEDDMKNNDYGSILSTVGCIGSDEWAETVDGFQQADVSYGVCCASFRFCCNYSE